MAKKKTNSKGEKGKQSKDDIENNPLVERDRYWSPFEMMRRFEQEMNEVMLGIEDRYLYPDYWRTYRSGIYNRPAVRQPLLDIEDTGNNILVTAEMPGIPKKNINVKLTEKNIEISANYETEKKDKGKDYYYRERGFQSYYRKLPLPEDVNHSKADATFEDGVLKVTLPKKESKSKELVKKLRIK
jgi:HSP20 family protein